MTTEAAARRHIVNLARQQLGHLYRDSAVKGNWPPAQFDCSVFAHWLYSSLGIDIDKATKDETSWPQPEPKRWRKYPGYTMTQVAALRGAGCEISFKQIQPGDLLYYSGNGHHVVVYVGDGKVVHAAGHAYGVITSPVVPPGKVGHGGKKLIGCFSPMVLGRSLGLITDEPKPAPKPSPAKPARVRTKKRGAARVTRATYQRKDAAEHAKRGPLRKVGFRVRYVAVIRVGKRTWLETRLGNYYKAENTDFR